MIHTHSCGKCHHTGIILAVHKKTEQAYAFRCDNCLDPVKKRIGIPVWQMKNAYEFIVDFNVVSASDKKLTPEKDDEIF